MNITPSILLYFAFIIFFGYLVIAILRYINTLDFIKKNFGNLEQFFELTFAVAILYIIFYPYWFIALAKDAVRGALPQRAAQMRKRIQDGEDLKLPFNRLLWCNVSRRDVFFS